MLNASAFHGEGDCHVVGTGSGPILCLPPARTVFLRLASLVVLLFSLWKQITCGGDSEAKDCKTCGYNYKELPVRTAWGLPGTPGSLKERWSWVGPDSWFGRRGELRMLEHSPMGMNV